MRSLWNESEAARCRSTLELRAYTSRLLGADPSLVLQGGGNTSLKSVWSMAGEPPVDCLYVKGSGADLSQVGPGDFTPLRRGPLGALLDGPTLDNDALMAALAPVQLRPDAPRPSIETLLHAAIPQPYVEHTHADAVLAVVNTADGRRRARDVFGERAPVVPFRHSGFELAAACRTTWQREATAQTIGLILEFHGVVAFGPDARTAYENMITLVDRAETYLQRRGAWTLARADAPVLDFDGALRMARLRRALSIAAGFPLVLHRDADPEVIAFVQRPDLSVLAQQGPPTPQHAVFTKRLPLLDGDVAAYVGRYRSVLRRFAPTDRPSQQLPDPAPRVVLDPTLGLVAASVDGPHARITAEIYRHDIAIMSRAAGHDRYRSLDDEAFLLAEIHYGGFDRRLRAAAPSSKPLLGVVVAMPDDLGPDWRAAVEASGAERIPMKPDESPAALAARHGGVDVVIDPDRRFAGIRGLVELLGASPFTPTWVGSAPGAVPAAWRMPMADPVSAIESLRRRTQILSAAAA